MKYYTFNDFDIFDFKQHYMVAENSISPFYYDVASQIKLYNLDTFSFFENIPDNCVDLIFADPPYFLSSGGITCSSGKRQNVNKGDWDTSGIPI